VKIGASARNKIKEEHKDLSYDDQCNKCEKVIITIFALFTYVLEKWLINKCVILCRKL